jgi:hypothetical protein
MTLKEILLEREKSYTEYTSKIFEVYSDKLNKLVPYLTGQDILPKWNDIVRYSENSNVVQLECSVRIEKGTTIKTTEGQKMLDEDMDMILNFFVTINGIEHLEPLELHREVYELSLYQKMLSNKEIRELFDDKNFTGSLKSKKYQKMYDKVYDNINDINPSNLSNEQLENLLINENLAKGKVN